MLLTAPAVASASPGALLVAGNDFVWPFTNGGSVLATQPFATISGTAITALCIGPAATIYAGTSQGFVIDITAGGNQSAATPYATVSGQVMALACNGSHVYALAGQQLFDVTGGGTVSTPFAYNFAGPLPFATDAFFGPAGQLYTLNGYGVIDASAGGDMAAAPYFVDGMGQDYLISGSSLGSSMFASSVYGSVYDITGGGTLGTPITSGLMAGSSRVLASPAGLFVLDLQAGLIDKVINGNPVTFAQGSGAGLSDMAYVPLCGDGYVHVGESCDGDGNGNGGETTLCDDDCTPATCGDGTVNVTAGESCDGDGNGNGGETALCDDDCSMASCGDGKLNPTAGEACDDGNTTDGDGCDASCAIETTGQGGGGAGGQGGAGGSSTGGAGGGGTSGTGGGSTGGAGGGSTSGAGGSMPSTTVCTPGQQVECACPGGAQGAQACNEDGTGFEACACPTVDDAPASPPAAESDGGCALATGDRRSSSGPWAWLTLALSMVAGARRRRRSAAVHE